MPSEPSVSRMLARGCLRHCPRCGSGGLFHGWFKMKDRCPRCGLRFEREEGEFLGAYVINYAAVSTAIAVVLVLVIAVEASGRSSWLVPLLAGGALLAMVIPIVCYPFSKTVWAAIELVMKPLDPREVADADQAEAAAKAATTEATKGATPPEGAGQ
jgi:uncharacterized protein (DUF983 family)